MKSFIKFAICLTSGEYHLKIQNSWSQKWGTFEKTTTSIARVNGRYRRVSRVSYSTLSRYYIGNEEYTQSDDGAITLTRLHNAIGYVVPSSDYKTVSGWYHYAKDYLGNVREVYRVNPNDSRALSLQRYAGVMGSSNAVTTARLASQVHQLCCTLVQSMNYYPSGLPLDNCTNSDEQPYKYTGKEYVEEHGLDEYDNGARWYYPALARTTTMDPHCESYYDQSPYSWCGNNFVNAVDIDGKDTVNFNYNHETKSFDNAKPIIAEGNDVINVFGANGDKQEFVFDKGDYGKRVNVAVVDQGTDDTYAWGVYHISGAESGGTGFFITRGGSPDNTKDSHRRILAGEYPLYGAIGDDIQWQLATVGGSVAGRGIKFHYAENNMAVRSTFLKNTKGCFVLTYESPVRNGNLFWNGSSSKQASINFNALLGGEMFEQSNNKRIGAKFPNNIINHRLYLK